MQMREAVRMAKMNVDLRFELDVVCDQRDEALRNVIRRDGSEDERCREMDRLLEDVRRA